MHKWKIDDLKKQIGIIVKINRLRRNMSQPEFGNEVNLSKTHISRIENGETNITLANIINICNFLELDYKNLFVKMDNNQLLKLYSEIHELEREFKNQKRRKS